MTFDDYTQGCLKTWGGDKVMERVAFAICEELGEVAGKYKKFYRGDFDEVVFRDGLKAELGDLLYYCAIGCNESNIKIDSNNKYINDNFTVFAIFECCLEHTKWIFNYLDCGKKSIIGEIMSEITFYVHCLIKTCGFTVEEVMKSNLEKLADRQNRGVIKGSGDDR